VVLACVARAFTSARSLHCLPINSKYIQPSIPSPEPEYQSQDATQGNYYQEANSSWIQTFWTSYKCWTTRWNHCSTSTYGRTVETENTPASWCQCEWKWKSGQTSGRCQAYRECGRGGMGSIDERDIWWETECRVVCEGSQICRGQSNGVCEDVKLMNRINGNYYLLSLKSKVSSNNISIHSISLLKKISRLS